MSKDMKMRLITNEEISQISGGQATCTVSGGTSGVNVSCSGTLSELGTLAIQAYAAAAAFLPLSGPALIERFR